MCYPDLDELEQLSRRLRLFSRNRWNLYGFHDADHLPGLGERGAALKQRVEQYLAGEGVQLGTGGRIRMLTLPRIAGYVFNPWFTLKYPLLTLQVIGLIHWHALRLWLKGLPWHRKADDPQLQQQVLRPSAELRAACTQGLVKP